MEAITENHPLAKSERKLFSWRLVNRGPITKSGQQNQYRRGMLAQGIADEAAIFQPRQPRFDHCQHHGQIQLFVVAGILGEIGAREFEQRRGGTQPLLLEMHERARELDQALVKITIRPLPIRQPKFFEHIVRFIKKLLVEAIKVTEIMRGDRAALKGGDAFGDFPTLPAHPFILAPPDAAPK